MTVIIVTFLALLGLISGALYLILHQNWLELIMSGLLITAAAIVLGMLEVRKLKN